MGRMTELVVREGDGDAERTGYWIVTGPQPEHEAFAIIERTREYVEGGHVDGYAWYLHQRQEIERGTSRMIAVAAAPALSQPEAVEALHAAWREHIESSPADADDDTAPITYPWRQA
jgi:hypothetical protein